MRSYSFRVYVRWKQRISLSNWVKARTRAFAILVDDPDALPVTGSVFVHFAIVNLPPNLRALVQNQDFTVFSNAQLLRNDFGTIGWSGPCPPVEDCAHEYRFTIYALCSKLTIDKPDIKLTVEVFERNFNKCVIAKAQFGAFYRLTFGTRK